MGPADCAGSAGHLRRLAAGVATLLVLGAGVALADGYLPSVREAERALRAAHLSSRQLVAIRDRLDAGTSCSQPEIADDLALKPAQVDDARRRLAALDDALSSPLQPRPGAQDRLRQLATQNPYNREQPESPGDYLNGTLQRFESWLVGTACGSGLAVFLFVLSRLVLAAAALIAIIVAYRLVRSYLRRGQEPAVRPGEADRLRTAAERFAAADRLAAAGDLAAAIRELAGAVATRLGGEAAWDLSPLTVREIYVEAGKLAELRPLLRGFEEAVYGHRPVTAEIYEAARAAAAPYRPVVRRAA